MTTSKLPEKKNTCTIKQENPPRMMGFLLLKLQLNTLAGFNCLLY